MAERFAFGCGLSGAIGNGAPSGAAEPPDRPAAEAQQERPAERRDWAFTGLLVFTGVLFLRPQDTVRVLQFIPIAEIAALFALAAMVSGRLGRNLAITRMTPEIFGVLALGGIILATAPFSIWPGGAVGTFTGMYGKVLLIFILMVNTLTSPQRVERFIWLIVLASGYLSLRAVIDYARGVNLIEYGRVQGSVGGMFKNPNDLALNMVTVMPLAGMLALRSLSVSRRLLGAFCFVVMIGAIVASQSRGGTVGLAAMLVVFGLWLMRRRPGLVFGVVLLGVLASPLAPASYWERVASIIHKDMDQTGSREARSILMREAWAAFLDHPLTGVGAGNFPVYNPEGRQEAWREVHNVLLQVAAELGVVGAVVFLFLVGSALYAPIQARHLLRRSQRGVKGRAPPHPLPPGEHEQLMLCSAALSASVVGWFVCAFFAPVAYHWTFYYVLALAIAPRDYLLAHLSSAAPDRTRARARHGASLGAHA